MISAFLTSLYNSDTSLTQSATTLGDIPLDTTYTPYAYAPTESVFNQLIYAGMTDAQRFGRAAQLTVLVARSPWTDQILIDDPRISYSSAQLIEHAAASPGDPLTALYGVGDNNTLIDALPEVWRRRVGASQSRLDRSLAICCYFGRKAFE